MAIKPIQFKRILYTTDLSDNALHAFSYAVSLASAYGASITVLHVLSDPARIEALLAGILMEDQWQVIKERHIKEARESLVGKRRDRAMIQDALSQFTENLQKDGALPVFEMDEVLVVWGDPVEQILKIAAERNSDLIILGTHGHILIEDVLGTTARSVTRLSRVPVLTVPLNN